MTHILEHREENYEHNIWAVSRYLWEGIFPWHSVLNSLFGITVFIPFWIEA
jgi:hypothetical protein